MILSRLYYICHIRSTADTGNGFARRRVQGHDSRARHCNHCARWVVHPFFGFTWGVKPYIYGFIPHDKHKRMHSHTTLQPVSNEITCNVGFLVEQGVVVVGSKRTDLYGVDPHSGKSSWMHLEVPLHTPSNLLLLLDYSQALS